MKFFLLEKKKNIILDFEKIIYIDKIHSTA
jgi:hypothetical protein